MTGGAFVTGTDTGVGKTVFAEALVWRWVQEGHRTAALKPVASGCRMTKAGMRNPDAERLLAVSNVTAAYATINPYCLEPAVAPHIAAAQADIRIEISRIRLCFDEVARRSDYVVVEGVGGWQVPLGPDTTVADLAVSLGLPVILVVAIRLGCLNHALLTAVAIQNSGASLFGWVANQVDPHVQFVADNIESLINRLDAPLLGVIPHLPKEVSAPIVNRYFLRATNLHGMDF